MQGSAKGADGVSALLAELRSLCRELCFAEGDELRRKGEHFRDMYLLTEGDVLIDFGGGARNAVQVGPGEPVGEMGFLSGRPASAGAVALTPVRALVLDDAVLARCEAERPELAVTLLRRLGQVVDDRTAQNLTLSLGLVPAPAGPPAEVLLCRDAEMLG